MFRRITILICLIAFVALCIAPANDLKAAEASPVRVVCIGDSITEGGTIIDGKITPTYRLELWKKFVDADIDVQFLGRDTLSPYEVYKGKEYPSQHLGWGGKRIEDVNQLLIDGEWGTAADGFDIAVILIGFNNASAWDGRPRPTVPEFNQLMKDLIATVRAKQSNVKIILQTSPTGTPTNIPEEYVKEYKNIADQSNTTASPVYYVPSPPTYNNAEDTTDGIHPNARGELKIANGMWNVIKKIVVITAPSINTITDATKTISGKAPANGTVTVLFSTKKKTAKVNGGSWKVLLTAPIKAGTKVTASVEVNGFSSPIKTTYVIPATPKVFTLKANAIVIKGTATKGGVVFAKIGTKTYSAKANTKTGSFAIKTPKLKKGTKVSVTCKAGGKTSAAKVLLVVI
ncbi:MAG: GDSL-type esterase/lipase family protein [Clostridia bacterium]